MRKVCIVRVAPGCVEALKSHLPLGVEAKAERELFDHDFHELRLEGDGLPDWCKTAEGCAFIRVACWIANDGKMQFAPGGGSVCLTYC